MRGRLVNAGRCLALIAAGAALSGLGCEASFESFREEALVPAGDVGGVDAAGVADAFAALDAGSPGEAGEVLGTGTFSGRSGYDATGQVTFRRTSAGLSLDLHEDFSSQGVPGPVVVLSEREALTGGLDVAKGDYELAVLAARSGAQSYPVPEAAAGSRYAWIYCRPFRVEIARALLEAP